MKPGVILAGVAAFVAALAGFVVLALAGKDTATFVGFVTTTVVSGFTLWKQYGTHQDVAKVKEQTNGPLTKLAESVEKLQQLYEQKGGDNAGSP